MTAGRLMLYFSTAVLTRSGIQYWDEICIRKV